MTDQSSERLIRMMNRLRLGAVLIAFVGLILSVSVPFAEYKGRPDDMPYSAIAGPILLFLGLVVLVSSLSIREVTEYLARRGKSR